VEELRRMVIRIVFLLYNQQISTRIEIYCYDLSRSLTLYLIASINLELNYLDFNQI
jgi:hypothetical protein